MLPAHPVSESSTSNAGTVAQAINRRRFPLSSPSINTQPNRPPETVIQNGQECPEPGAGAAAAKALLLALTVNRTLAGFPSDKVTADGVIWHDTPCGMEPHAKSTGPVKPFIGVAVMSNTADCPGASVALVGVAQSEVRRSCRGYSLRNRVACAGREVGIAGVDGLEHMSSRA